MGGKWLTTPYKLPGTEGYTASQDKGVPGPDCGMVLITHNPEDPTEPKTE
jgi:hypothetical protein